MTGKSRPTGVTVLGILEILGGIGALLLGLFIILMSAMLSSIAGGFTIGIGPLAALMGAIGGFIGGILALIGVVNFIIAYGLFKGRGWGRMLCLVFCIIGIIFGLILLPIGVVPIVVDAVFIYYLTRSHVKDFFGKTSIAS